METQKTGKCTHCKEEIRLCRYGLTQYHDFPKPSRRVCPGSRKLPGIDYGAISPGVRDLVRELREVHQKNTVDSGDGSAWASGMECAIRERHVMIQTYRPDEITDCAEYLAEQYPEAHVECSWSPGEPGIVILWPDGRPTDPSASLVDEPKGNIEELAAAQHQIWSHWMKYQFRMCESYGLEDGDTLFIPRELEERWRRQMNTPYADLSEEEKESDRKVVWEFLSDVVEE